MRISNFDATPAVRMAVLLLISGLSLLPGGAQAGYIYQNVINPGDPTFNQELGINNAGTIAGYFGSGAPNGTPPPFTLTPNQGRWGAERHSTSVYFDSQPGVYGGVALHVFHERELPGLWPDPGDRHQQWRRYGRLLRG